MVAFTPPTHEESMRTNVRPLNYFRLTWAASIVRIGGVLTQVRSPNHDQLTAAGVEGVDWFIGGRVYNVSGSVQTELASRGFL